MRWSLRLLKVAGIGIYVHVTFLLLLIWAGWSGYGARHQWNDAAAGVGFILILFVIVVLHELGHALTARRFGIETRDIILLPIGGVARLERMPEDPKQELAVALAGPAVNVLLAILFFIAISLGATVSLHDVAFFSGNLLENLLWINILLALFNLLPAFPMDGGRVLRALLAIRINYARATRIAARIGQGMALVFGVLGLFYNPFLILIAAFVWIGAAQESSFVQMKSSLDGIRVHNVMITDFRTLAPDDTLSRAVELLLGSYQQDFPVVSGGRLVGLLTRTGLVNGLARTGSNLLVSEAMEKEFPVVHPNDPAEGLFLRLQGSPFRSMPVVENGNLLGIITSENVGEFLMVRGAMHDESPGQNAKFRMTERHAT
ncbi:MAG TPA: site-2 protease family protein [Verrucomicrobiae bacterium]|nr:site-2 protease family protein [Verrucomicrobiae bacterium]